MSSFYDDYNYPAYWETRIFEDLSERLALSRFLQQIEKRNSLVDVGGGFGRLSPVYSPVFKKCLVIDPSKNLLEIGKTKFKDFSNLSFTKGELPKLPIKDKEFEVALMVRVIHHLSDPLPAFKEVYRILQQRGFLILEMANKIHFLARLKACFSGNFSFSRNLESIERRSSVSIREGKITFVNHHPQKIIGDLESVGFTIVKTLSVSNFRNPLIKKIIPQNILLFFENKAQELLAPFFFGPSIFILAKK